jgi:hypothetical protein
MGTRAERAPEAAASTDNERARGAQETNGAVARSDTAQPAQPVAAATQAEHAGARQQHDGETHSSTSTTTFSAPNHLSSSPDPAAIAAQSEARRAAVERRKWLKSMLPLMEQRIAELEVQAAVLKKRKRIKQQETQVTQQVVCSLGTKNEFSALLCPSTINGIEFSGSLLDSGASLSCVAASTLPRLHLTEADLLSWSSGRVKGAGGNNLNILGTLYAMISVGGGSTVPISFIVVDNLAHDVILGLDALDAMGASLTFKNGHVVFKPDGAPHATTIQVAKSRVLRMSADVRIEPRTVSFISASIDGAWAAESDTYLLEPDTMFLADRRHSNIHIARGIYSAANITPLDVPIQIINTAPTSVYFRRGDIIAHLSKLDDSEFASVASIELSNFNDMVADDAGDNDIPEPPRPVSKAELERQLNATADAHTSMDEATREKFRAFLHEYADVFAANSSAPDAAHSVHHSIDTGTHAPIRQRPRPLNPTMTKVVNDQVAEMLQDGIIRPSNSAWSSPVVLVKKKHGQYRFCIDYRQLNAITNRDSFPLPNMTATLDSLHGAKIWTTLDMASGFWQIKMAEDSKAKTAFTTSHGTFEFERLPFGLLNSPASFTRFVDLTLAGLAHCALPYMDDVIVYSKSEADHFDDLRTVFDRFRAAGVHLKLEKAGFFATNAAFLGHQITANGLGIQRGKVDAIIGIPAPRDVPAVRRFLGCCSFYRRFVKHFSTIAAPLTDLTKKHTKFLWSDECETSFLRLKSILASEPVVAFPDYSLPFIVSPDASDVGLGATLSQNFPDGERVVAYASRALNAAEKNYGSTEKELLGLLYAVSHFKPYLFGTKFTVITDHAALLWLRNFREQNARLARWALLLSDQDFEVQHRPGKEHTVPDCLSRDAIYPSPFAAAAYDAFIAANADHSQSVQSKIASFSVASVSASSPRSQRLQKAKARQTSVPPQSVSFHSGSLASLPISAPAAAASSAAPSPPPPPKEGKVEVADIPRLQRDDSSMREMILYLESGTLPDDVKAAARIKAEADKFCVTDSILHRFRQDANRSKPSLQLVVPEPLRRRVFSDHHDGAMAGHLGVTKTYLRLLKDFWWDGMHSNIYKWVALCPSCSARKSPRGKKFGRLQPIDIPEFLDTFAVDFCSLPTTNSNNSHLIVFCEYVTRFVIAIATEHCDAATVANALVCHVFPFFGAARRLLSDCGKAFKATLIEEVCDVLRTKKIFTSTYHPQTDGLVERMNGTLQAMLSKFVETHQRDWDTYLPFVVFAYNSAPQASTGESPFFLLYGRDPRMPTDLSMAPSRALAPQFKDVAEYRADLVKSLEEARALARQHLQAAQAEQKRRYDQSHIDAPFLVGDRVWLYTPRVDVGQSKKLARLWVGPYRIIKLVGTTAWLRNVGSGVSLQQCVPVSRLKPYHDPPSESEVPTGLDQDAAAFDADQEEDEAFYQEGDVAINALVAQANSAFFPVVPLS